MKIGGLDGPRTDQERQAKLCDFGLAAIGDFNGFIGVCGTPLCMSPEMLRPGESYFLLSPQSGTRPAPILERQICKKSVKIRNKSATICKNQLKSWEKAEICKNQQKSPKICKYLQKID